MIHRICRVEVTHFKPADYCIFEWYREYFGREIRSSGYEPPKDVQKFIKSASHVMHYGNDESETWIYHN